jgi:two-component system cell cycle response regulator DivK
MWGTGKTILVVEDNILNVKLLAGILAAHGCRVVHAGDGRAALALARADHPDVVLMDIQLPGNSGLEVARWFKDDVGLSRIPVVAVSAFVEQVAAQELANAGVAAACAKPIKVSDLMTTLRQFA